MHAQGQQPREKGVLCVNKNDQKKPTSPLTLRDDEFGDDDIDDQDMANAGRRLCPTQYLSLYILIKQTAKGMDFSHVDDFDTSLRPSTKGRSTIEQSGWNPERLENGKWACNHRCKDKTA